MAEPLQGTTVPFEQAAIDVSRETYVLRLYVAGTTRFSLRAMNNIRSFCDRYLPGRHDLQVIDIYQQPALANSCQILAAPTLIKEFPPPVRKFIGDLSQTDRLLKGLDIPAAEQTARAMA